MRKLIQPLKDFSRDQPLSMILILSIITRLIAVLFAKGFGMHDDHFVVIETAQSWVDGLDIGKWFPWTEGNQGPQGHSVLYPGFNYICLLFADFIGLKSPDAKMFLIRLIHAAISLITVVIGYKITLKTSGPKVAFSVGIILAILWVMPWLSVRTMVEIVSIPFLLLSTWSLIKNDFSEKAKMDILPFIISGIWAGLAFSIRFQVAFFILGLGLVILIKKGFVKSLWFTLGFLIVLFLTQGLIDFLIWKRPFAELMEYARYNVVHKGDYPNGPWYNYILVVMGLVIPPISFMLVAGVFKSWKKHLILFLPLFVFFAFHSYFPNKQERFILPILPFFIILGMVGWHEIREKKRLKWFTPKAEKGVWIFAFSLNLILLVAISTMYSKKSRVESMLYLNKYENVQSFMIENTVDNTTLWSPLFYAGQYPQEFIFTQENPIDSIVPWNTQDEPRFVLFYTTDSLQKRVDNLKKVLPKLSYATTIYPSYVDRFLSTINPVNKNYVVTIYRNDNFNLTEKK